MKEIPEVEQNAANAQIKISFRSFYLSMKALLVETLNIRQGADIPGTIESVKRDVVLKGHNIWILILSILIASIGLNLNSGAVVIGAMLISPLMAPIMGLGLAIGTNNINLLVLSIRNLILMMIIAIGASFLYFSLSPFSEAQSEILARTKPHLLDALIAIFGGVAGIIGNSRKERSNIIPGVAIATALMPPLCTVGYGLAMGKFEYSLGAFYLFTLNSSFICISTLVLVKLMRFPMASYVNKKRKKLVKSGIFIFSILILIPSLILFKTVVEETTFKKEAKLYLENEFKFEESYVFKANINYHTDTTSVIEVFVLGESIDSTLIINLTHKLNNYKLQNTSLVIRQSKDKNELFQKELHEVSSTSETYKDRLEHANATITFQDTQIKALIDEINQIKNDTLPISTIRKELKIIFSNINDIQVASVRTVKDTTIENIPLFLVDWNKQDYRYNSVKRKELTKVERWLKQRLQLDTLAIIKK